MKQPTFIVFLSFCLSMLYACTGTNSTAVNRKNGQDTLVYEVKKIYEFSKFFLKEGETIDSTYFRASYPYFQDSILNKLISSSIYLDGDTDMDHAAKRFIAGYNEYIEENDGESTGTWFRDFEVKVFQNTKKLLSIETNQNDYTGGAHGDHFTIYNHYDVETDQKILLNDLIKVENQKEFTKIAERYFRKLENLSSSDSLNDKFFFEDGHFTLANNFALAKNELLFFYNVYEIKSYAEGTTILKIPYADIKHLISARGLAYINSIN